MDGVLRYEWFTTTERWLHRGLSDGDGLTYEEMMTTPILLRTRSNLFFSTARQVNPCFRAYSSINCNTPFNICFVRHGQSTWNRDNRFIGWTDTPLTEDGVLEARVAGRMLQSSGILFDEAHTSLLRRCIRTTNLILMEMGQVCTVHTSFIDFRYIWMITLHVIVFDLWSHSICSFTRSTYRCRSTGDWMKGATAIW